MRCLIVEDSKVIIQIITQLVRNVSFENHADYDSVTHADNVPQALNLLSKKQFDYIFLDLNLREELDGLQVLEYVRKQQKNIPVFIVTGDNNINTVKQVIKLQPTDYLVKPVSKMKITRCLEKAKMTHKLNITV
ncbi:response regulator [Moritella sp. Urea-trap-13]|uniref:response regulator n=1 Tax=Moritella sp. Urea-trap-13 TaxID=2058327 RepID=UPI000C32B409|nr:response regulator [Moritella sp. Urea-trap-13]PKH05548.1 response regulator [Moritella sp. Urea-trap-13]